MNLTVVVMESQPFCFSCCCCYYTKTCFLCTCMQRLASPACEIQSTIYILYILCSSCYQLQHPQSIAQLVVQCTVASLYNCSVYCPSRKVTASRSASMLILPSIILYWASNFLSLSLYCIYLFLLVCGPSDCSQLYLTSVCRSQACLSKRFCILLYINSLWLSLFGSKSISMTLSFSVFLATHCCSVRRFERLC